MIEKRKLNFWWDHEILGLDSYKIIVTNLSLKDYVLIKNFLLKLREDKKK